MTTTNQVRAANAAIAGTAGRVSAAEEQAAELQADRAVLRATVHITRAATGKVETYELVGTAGANPQQQEP